MLQSIIKVQTLKLVPILIEVMLRYLYHLTLEHTKVSQTLCAEQSKGHLKTICLTALSWVQ